MKLTVFIVLVLTSQAVFAAESLLNVTTYDYGASINDVCVSGDKLLCATDAGLMTWDRRSMSYEWNSIIYERDGYWEPPRPLLETSLVEANSQGWVMVRERSSKVTAFSDGTDWVFPENAIFKKSQLCLFTDSKDRFWGGTIGYGMFMWDGAVPTIYKTNNGLNNARAFAIDDNAVVWIGTNQGLYSIDGDTEVHYTEYSGFLDNNVTCVLADNGIIWAGTRKGLMHFDGSVWTAYTTSDGLINNNITDIALDHSGNVWVATISGVSRFDGVNFSSYTGKNELMDDKVTSIAVDNENRVWFCTSNDDKGITVYENGTWLWYTRFDKKLPVHEINMVANDRDGNIWIAWDEGCAKRDGEQWEMFSTADGLAGEDVKILYPGDNGSMWAVFRNSTTVGISRYSDGVWQTFTSDDELPENKPLSLHETADGTVWLCYSDGLMKMKNGAIEEYNGKSSLLSDTINDIKEAPDGAMWLATSHGLSRFDGSFWRTYTSSDGLLSNFINSVEIGPDGTVWCLVGFDYLMHFDGERFTHIQTPDGRWSGIFSGIKVDNDGVLWAIKDHQTVISSIVKSDIDSTSVSFSDDDVGLYSYDGALWRYHAFPDDDLWSGVDPITITVDDENILWCGTDAGLARYDGSTWSLHTVDGPVNSQVNHMAVDMENVKWFATNKGISSLDTGTWRHYQLEAQNTNVSVMISFDRILVDPKSNKKWFIAAPPYSELISYDGHEFKHHTKMFSDVNAQIDKEGVLWRIHARGIASYNGVKITEYTKDDGLYPDRYKQLYVEGKHRKWFISNSGLTSFDGETFKNHYTEDIDFRWGLIRLQEDSKGTLWILYNSDDILSYDGEIWNNFPDERHLNWGFTLSMEVLEDDTVRVINRFGVLEFDGTVWDLKSNTYQLNTYNGIWHTDILDRQWRFSSDQIRVYDHGEWYSTNNTYLVSNQFDCFSDMDGSVWILDVNKMVKLTPVWQNESLAKINGLSLKGAYPNPFNAGTAIEFELSEFGRVDLDIYNMLGQKVRSIHSLPQPVGKSAILWDGTDNSGVRVSSGSYFYRINAGAKRATGRMMFVK